MPCNAARRAILYPKPPRADPEATCPHGRCVSTFYMLDRVVSSDSVLVSGEVWGNGSTYSASSIFSFCDEYSHCNLYARNLDLERRRGEVLGLVAVVMSNYSD